ncbi:MAG: hypothetical protein WBM35_08385 [Candidatus Electrothrix sp.]
MKKKLLVTFLCLTASAVWAKGGWIIDQKTQCEVWDPTPTPNQSLTWSGECENGKANSEGIAKWHKGNKVVSSIQGVMKEGRCLGECLAIVSSGKGKFKYIGQLKDNDLHGKGILTWPDGNEYSGDWIEGKRHGSGKFVWKNGTQYIGDWRDDKSTGKGTYTWIDRDEKKYIGDMKEDKFHGNGVMFYTSGDKYSGSWSNGKRHGKGTYTFQDGTTYKGIWENGQRIQIFPRLRDFLFW